MYVGQMLFTAQDGLCDVGTSEEQVNEHGTSSGLTLATEVQKQGGTQWMFFT